MISPRLGKRAQFLFPVRDTKCNTMMAADRSANFHRAILFLLFSLGFSGLARAGGLEDSAKDLAGKIAAALPGRESVSFEIRNQSSLEPGDVGRIEQALSTSLNEHGIHTGASGGEVTVAVTLSENFKNLVWTAQIRKGDTAQVVLVAVERSSASRPFQRAMPVTIHSEKFWEGPERILDALEVSNGPGKSWLVLLLPDGVRIQDKPAGAAITAEIPSLQSANRDPWGNLNAEPAANTIGIFLAPHTCVVNLEAPDFGGCLHSEGAAGGPPPARIPVMFDLAPAGPPPPGKGTLIEMQPVCGGATQFLATGARDYTQTDSLQVFQTMSQNASASTGVAVSAEMELPGPVTGLHALSGAPRAVVRNLATGNYEAYRLSFACGQ